MYLVSLIVSCLFWKSLAEPNALKLDHPPGNFHDNDDDDDHFY